MSDNKKIKLIAIYMYISELYRVLRTQYKYEIELQYTCQRFSNNFLPEFTDQELMTIYLFAVTEERRFQIKEIHEFANNYLRSWFPKLPSYQAFNNRLNRLSEAFKTLAIGLFTCHVPEDCDLSTSLVDSLPIITCKGRNRKAKVAREIVDKGWCSTKNLFYYGLKLHLLGFRRQGTIPFPELIGITAASENDLTAFRELFGDIVRNRVIWGDKIYIDHEYFEKKWKEQNVQMLTPVKLVKGEAECVRQREKAYLYFVRSTKYRDLYSAHVSKFRQPIESFFNWLNEKTKIQEAQKVRSKNGLYVHVFGKIAAALLYLIF